MISAPPSLAIPAAPQTGAYQPPFGATIVSRPPDPFTQATPTIPRVPRAGSRPATPDYVAPSYPDYRYNPPAIAPSQLPDLPGPPKASDPESLAGPRVGATRLANPTTTVPKGAVIQAVLETALDSNRPGFARAIVSRDVRGFDGSRILIPRGSRLVGEYKADLAQGQNRAFVQWQTLTRPDGVQIAVDSPAADPLGRAGVKGNVNSHFFERFAGAILQSTLDIGVGIATRKVANGTVIVGLPGSTQSIGGVTPQSIKPTLKVPHGSSVSVFVARDLDFIAVE
jgi:type IV secretion system protein VirB10